MQPNVGHCASLCAFYCAPQVKAAAKPCQFSHHLYMQPLKRKLSDYEMGGSLKLNGIPVFKTDVFLRDAKFFKLSSEFPLWDENETIC